MDKHAYINIEPNNGGIVLNVSDEGLCFHAFDPVRRNGPIRFWFSHQNRRIDAEAELAWTDATQKGGLRFKVLPAEAHEQIRSWISRPAMPGGNGKGPTPSAPTLHTFPPHNADPPAADVARAPIGPAPQAEVPREAKTVAPLRGFSGGFAAGLAVSLLVMGAFLFHIYRNQIGESLIRLGERFAATPPAQAQTVTPLPETLAPVPVTPAQQTPLTAAQKLVQPQVSPPPQTATLERQPPLPTLAPATQPDKPLPKPLTNQEKPQQAKLAAVVPTTVVPNSTGSRAPEVLPIADSRTISSARPPIPLPTTAVAPDSSLPASKAATTPQLDPPGPQTVPANNSTVESARAESADATSQMYFEVGGFKNKQQANSATDKLTQLGFPATAVHKNHLWSDAYHVVVGPYGDDEEATATHQNLVSHGFKPRPFERGTRTLVMRSGVTLNGTRMPVGECVVSWESYVSDAAVKFVHDNDVVATTNGRWVKRDTKYSDDAYVYRKNGDGSRTLLEIRFAGMRQALVFGKSS